jgi:hypothetical protein
MEMEMKMERSVRVHMSIFPPRRPRPRLPRHRYRGTFRAWISFDK